MIEISRHERVSIRDRIEIPQSRNHDAMGSLRDLVAVLKDINFVFGQLRRWHKSPSMWTGQSVHEHRTTAAAPKLERVDVHLPKWFRRKVAGAESGPCPRRQFLAAN